MESYRQDTGNFPGKIEDLNGNYIKTVPKVPASENVKLKGKSYSIGSDGKISPAEIHNDNETDKTHNDNGTDKATNK